MEFESLSETVKKALEHWDNQNWNNKNLVDNQYVKFDELNSTITFFIDDTIKIYN
jgi:hypothetical protein